MNVILISYCCSQTCELYHIPKEIISHFYMMILSCILVMIHEHVLSFLCILQDIFSDRVIGFLEVYK